VGTGLGGTSRNWEHRGAALCIESIPHFDALCCVNRRTTPAAESYSISRSSKSLRCTSRHRSWPGIALARHWPGTGPALALALALTWRLPGIEMALVQHRHWPGTGAGPALAQARHGARSAAGLRRSVRAHRCDLRRVRRRLRPHAGDHSPGHSTAHIALAAATYIRCIRERDGARHVMAAQRL
jgi:hypothetical protein